MTPLHSLGDWLRGVLLQIPLSAARALFVVTLLALLVWVLMLPRSQTSPGDERPRLSENLKIWASIALLIQIVIYLLL